ncbi:MAG: metalloregulator ArsR/SmtB family transcription factor [Chlamydiales bacterium]|nr:metalloregulator ArsR/SmtB family transcription factor [Chlamydiales bacterium]
MMTPDELFAILSDETRLRCLLLLQKEKELCVCELSQVLGSMQPKISRHLALMRQSGLISDERRSQWVYYRLNNNLQGWIHKILATILRELKDHEPYCFDLEKIKELRTKNTCS